MTTGFPNVVYVIGDAATLVVDTGLGNTNGALVVRVNQGAIPPEPATVATELAAAIQALLGDRPRLTELGEYVEKARQDRSAPRTAEAFVAAWSELLGTSRG